MRREDVERAVEYIEREFWPLRNAGPHLRVLVDTAKAVLAQRPASEEEVNGVTLPK